MMVAQSESSDVRAGVTLRAMTPADLPAAHALTAELRWPHRLADWEQAFRHAEGFVAEVGSEGHVGGDGADAGPGAVIGTGLRWRWGERRATLGLIVVSPAWQGRRVGRRLMTALLHGLDEHVVLLHATRDGRGLYERLGFIATGELRQHQGTALPAPLIALAPGLRLRAASPNDAPALKALDAAARSMPRHALIDDLLASAEATAVLDEQGEARGFAVLRRFGRGHSIGPVAAPDETGAKALIAHLAGVNTGRFTRIDVDHASNLSEWLERLGLACVAAPTTMVRGASLMVATGGPMLYATVTQALG